MAIPLPPRNPNDPFLSNLAFTASGSQAKPRSDDTPPLLDLVANITPRLMAGPAQVERASYNEHRPRRPPPDLPSLLLNSRIIFIGMPLVPAVTELVIAEFLYLQWLDPRQPTYVYINSTGTSREDGETVALETEGFAIYDTMMQMKNEIHTVAFGAAVGQACLLLAAGKKGKRYMLPHAQVLLQQPRLPATGQMPAIDVHIRAKELIHNRDTFVKLLAKHTGNPFETVAKAMERPFYMFPRQAVEFGVADKILWQGQEAIGDTPSPDEWDKRAGIKLVERPVAYGAGSGGLG
jgi:ATP-dependent Clp endopeptidase proteolytic subunit ClpP